MSSYILQIDVYLSTLYVHPMSRTSQDREGYGFELDLARSPEEDQLQDLDKNLQGLSKVVGELGRNYQKIVNLL